MEADRFGQNQHYYIIGVICLIISLTLFAFSLYILPFLAFNWHYNVPDFVPIWCNDFKDYYKLSDTAANWLFFLLFFLPAFLFAIIADILSNQIDNKIHGINAVPVKKESRKADSTKESNTLIFKIIAIIIFVFIAAEFFQWVISSNPTI